MSGGRQGVFYNSPVLARDWLYEVGEEIRACNDCLPWYAELVLEDGALVVREWHGHGCPVFDEEAGA